MGLNALNRNDKYNVSAVYYKREHIRTDGTAMCGTHIKVKIEDKRNKSVSQPIQNLMTDSTTMLVSTRNLQEYDKYDELYLMGKRWQIVELQTAYENTEINGLTNPQLLAVHYLALNELGGKPLWIRP